VSSLFVISITLSLFVTSWVMFVFSHFVPFLLSFSFYLIFGLLSVCPLSFISLSFVRIRLVSIINNHIEITKKCCSSCYFFSVVVSLPSILSFVFSPFIFVICLLIFYVSVIFCRLSCHCCL